MKAVSVAVVLALGAVTAHAQEPLAQSKRGLTGQVEFAFDGAALEARPQLDLSAPILLRLERVSNSSEYVARFLGAVEGDYDLRELIQRRDGGVPADLPPLPVRVVSSLEDAGTTDLFDVADLDVAFSGRYWILATLAVLTWLAVPAFVIVRRVLRKPPVDVGPEVVRAPTLADQLRPLCEAAASRALTVHEQGRLELLLYHFWRERLSLVELDVAAAIARLRQHDDAGELLLAIESWLHRPDATVLEPAELDALLAPYRQAPAVPEAQPR